MAVFSGPALRRNLDTGDTDGLDYEFFPAASATVKTLEEDHFAGALVEVCALYRTVTAPAAGPEVLRQLREGAIDAIAFASGSAARGFVALAGAAAAGPARVACMGRQCAEETRKGGLRVDAVADGSLPELCDAVALALRKGRD